MGGDPASVHRLGDAEGALFVYHLYQKLDRGTYHGCNEAEIAKFASILFEIANAGKIELDKCGLTAMKNVDNTKIHAEHTELLELGGLDGNLLGFPSMAQNDAAMRLVDLYFKASKERAGSLKETLGGLVAAWARPALDEGGNAHEEHRIGETAGLLKYALSWKCTVVSEHFSWLFHGWQFQGKNKAALVNEGGGKSLRIRGGNFKGYIAAEKHGVWRLFESGRRRKGPRWEIGTLLAGEIICHCIGCKGGFRLAQDGEAWLGRNATDALSYISRERKLPYAVRKTAKIALETGKLPAKEEVLGKMKILRRWATAMAPLKALYGALDVAKLKGKPGQNAALRPA